MASNTEQSTNEEPVQKINSTSSSDVDKTKSNINMTDENRDPSTTKFRPKPVDARSAAAASLTSCSSLDSPKSATITNVSQRLPSTSVEVSVGDILSTEEKRASVSIREQQSQQQQEQHRHSSSSCSSSDYDEANENTFSTTTNKMDLGEATRELTRLLHIGNENTNNEIHLNPDAPDFTPIEFSATYRSELAPAHLNRRTTQTDYYNNRQSRSRYYSESYHHSIPPNTSTIRPLLSLVPQYVPHHRQSWTTTSGQNSSSSNNSWWQQDYSNPSSSTSSYHSKAAYPLYSPLMPPLTDDSLYTSRNSSKRQRIQSNRTFVFPSQNPLNRKRSHSGPETPLQPPPTHLNGIHSLAKIMIDILRMIDPLPVQEETKPKTSSTSSYSSQQRKYRRSSNNYSQHRSYQSQQQNSPIDVEDVFVDDNIPTISATVMNNEHTSTTTVSNLVNDNNEKEVLISTDTTNDESFYEVPTHYESSNST